MKNGTEILVRDEMNVKKEIVHVIIISREQSESSLLSEVILVPTAAMTDVTTMTITDTRAITTEETDVVKHVDVKQSKQVRFFCEKMFHKDKFCAILT